MREINRPPNPVIRLMLIEDDPVFRVGFTACLEPVSDLQIVLEADSIATALLLLSDRLGSSPLSTAVWTPGVAETIPDLIILSLDLERGIGLSLCQQLKTRYPNLQVLLLSSQQEPTRLAAAIQAGAGGFCLKGTAVPELIAAIRQVATGRPYWNQSLETLSQALISTPAPSPPASSPPGLISGQSSQTLAQTPPQNLTALTVLRRNLQLSGLQQIEAAIATINTQLQSPQLSLLDQLFLQGRRRELRTARWLVNRLLASPASLSSPASVSSPPPSSLFPLSPLPSPFSPASVSSPSPHIPLPHSPNRSIQAALFDTIAAKLQTSLPNLTETPLEIDILKEEKKRELLYLILRKLEEILDNLRFSHVQLEQLGEKQTAVLQDLWQATMTDFFGKYFTLQVGVGSSTPQKNTASQDAHHPVEIVEVLLQDREIVQAAILDKIPYLQGVLAHLLFQEPLTIDDASYAIGTVEAMTRMEILLQNLAIQIANAVVQPLLNRFGSVETIKQMFYDKRLLSTREIERFRNNLSWKYRIEKYFGEPTAIFESRHNLFVVREGGITKTSIYTPRNEELANLSGVPLAVTLALELRDAIAPRLRSAISFVGNGVVYLLTDVIGRGIGLVGRGIVKGIGNALQDARINRDSGRGR